MENSANEVINQEMLFLQADICTKKTALEILGEQAASLGLVQDASLFLQAVLSREMDVPTAIGYEIAIPHGKSDTVRQPFIGFLQAKKAFQWTDGYEEVVRLVFLIGISAQNEQTHLRFISQLSKKLLDEEFRNQLKVATNRDTVYQLLRSIDL